MNEKWLVYRKGVHPKPKRHFYKITFSSRRSAKNFCRNRAWEEGLTIVGPDGKEESYEKSNERRRKETSD